MWLLLSMLIAAAPPRAQISPSSRCDRALADALRRSRALELVTANAELLIVLRDVSAGFTLELQRPGGERLLQRQLAQNPECRDVAFASVLIVERFLRGIDLRAPPPPPAPVDAGAPPPPPKRPPPPEPIVDAGAPPPPPEEPVDAGAVAKPEPEPEPEPADAGVEPERPDAGPPPAPTFVDAGPPPPPPGLRITRLELAASGGVDLSSTPHGLFALDAALFLHGLRLGVLAHAATPDSSPVTIAGVQRGRLETQSFGALATFGYCRGPTVRLCGLAHAGARLVRGSTSGDFLFQSTTAWLVRPAFALEAQLGWLPVRGLVLYLSLAGALSPAPAEFTVDGAPGSTRRLPIFEGQLRLGAGFGVDR